MEFSTMIMISSCSFYGVTDRKSSGETYLCILLYTPQNSLSQTMLPKSELVYIFYYHKSQIVFIFPQTNDLLLVYFRKFWNFWIHPKNIWSLCWWAVFTFPPKITAPMGKLVVVSSQAKLLKQGNACLQLVKALKSVRKENDRLSFRFWFIRKN